MPVAPRPPLSKLHRGRHGIPREQVRQQQRIRMLEAMARTVGDKGYAKTTVQDVLERSGVSSKTFYEHFNDKEDCFLQAYDAVVERVMVVVTNEYSRVRRWPDRVQRGLSSFLRFAGDEEDLARMAIVEVLAAGPRARERYETAVRRFMGFFEAGRIEARHPERLPTHLSEAVVGGIAATMYHHLITGRAEQLPLLLPDLLYCSLVPYLGHSRAASAARRATVPSPGMAGVSTRRRLVQPAVTTP